jgi:uncharacterized protein YecE (DUF72 family)
MLKIGCCGFPIAKGKYFQELLLVEIQKTFYQLPLVETAQRWREQAPDCFEFTLKAWQNTLQIAEALRASVIVLQCPPRFTETEENRINLAQFFQSVPFKSSRVAIEFRAQWHDEIIRDICQKFGLIHCVDPFKEEPCSGEIRYYRLHGSPPGKRMYRYQYRPQDFKFLSARINADFHDNRAVYCLFNNLSMWDDARSFQKYFKIDGTVS